ncbi:MAG: hypothetical protein ABI162_08740 [Luteolibacter sp.]
MSTAPFYKFPAHQAVDIVHPAFDFETGSGLIAVVAPTFTPGVSHFGICEVKGTDWKLINGPSIIKSNRIWRRLFDISEDWESSTSNILDKNHNNSIPTKSPDDFADLIAGGAA